MVRKGPLAFSISLGFQARHHVSAHHPLAIRLDGLSFWTPQHKYTRHGKKEITRELTRRIPRIHCLKVATFPASHDVGPQIDGLSFPPRPRFSAVEVPGKEREQPRACQVGSNVLPPWLFLSFTGVASIGSADPPHRWLLLLMAVNKRRSRGFPLASVTRPRADLQSTRLLP